MRFISILSLLFISLNLFAKSPLCEVPVAYKQLECSGTIVAKNLNDLISYKQNLGIKKNKVKNLVIDFNLTDSSLTIATPCQITVNENHSLNISGNICLHGDKGVFVYPYNKVYVHDIRLESKEEAVFMHHNDIHADNIELVSLTNSMMSKTRIGYSTSVTAESLFMESFDRSSIGNDSNINLTGNFSLFAYGEEDAIIGQNSKVKADRIEVSLKDDLHLSQNVNLVSNSELILNAKLCNLNARGLVLQAGTDKLGSCFLISSPKGLFTIDKNNGYMPLVVNFDASKIKTAQSFQWLFGDNQTLETTENKIVHTYSSFGNYTAILKYAESKNKKGQFVYNKSAGSVQINVKAIKNLPPVANLACTVNNLLVNCNGLSSFDPELQPLTYNFTYSDGYSETNTNGLSTHSFVEAGLANVKLTVTDIAGASTTTSMDVMPVRPPNILPIAKINCESTLINQVSCNSTGSTDSDGTIQSYKFSFDDNSVVIGQTATHTFTSGGDHIVSLEVIDNDGGSTTTSTNVNVLVNHAPSVSINCTSPDYLKISCTANASDSDPQDSVQKYSFTINGTESFTQTTNNFTYTFDTEGSKAISVVVTDSFGATSTVSTNVTVQDNPKNKIPPVAYFKYFLDGTYATLRLGNVKTVSEIKTAYYIVDGTTRIDLNLFYPNMINTIDLLTIAQHSVQLFVEDVKGNKSNFTHTFQTKDSMNEVPPHAEFEAKEANLNTIYFDFTKSFSARDGEQLSGYFIDYGDGTSEKLGDEFVKNYTVHTYSQAGTYQVTLTVNVDGVESSKTKSVNVSGNNVGPINPTASFMYYIFSFAGNVTFYDEQSGTANGEIISWLWDFGDGTSGTGKDTTHFYNPGNYLVTLTVTDSMGLTSSQTQYVTIVDSGSDLATSFNCSPSGGLGVNCNIIAVDKFNQINRVKIGWGDNTATLNPPQDYPSFGVYNVNHTYTKEGTFNVKLQVDTSRGQSSIVTTTVGPLTLPKPVADIQCETTNLLVTCNALGSYDPSGGSLSFVFDWGDTITEQNATGAATHAYQASGTYTVKVTVKTNSGKTATATTTVMPLEIQNLAPIAGVFCKSDTPFSLTCSPSGSNDQDGHIVEYIYTFDDGSVEYKATNDSFTKIFSNGGEKSVTLKITDNDGASATTTASFTVKENTPPIIASINCYSDKPQHARCIANAYDLDINDQIINYEWSFGDSNSQSGMIPSSEHNYASADTYTITLKVKDQYGGETTQSTTLSVKENHPPTLSPKCFLKEGTTVYCESYANDIDAQQFTVSWSVDGITFSGLSILYNITNGGNKIFTVTATDELGLSTSVDYSYDPELPIADFTCLESKPYNITCNYTKSANETREIMFKRFFVDNSDVYEGETFNHEFLTPGEHTITLNVFDADGKKSEVTKKIIINKIYQEPLPAFEYFNNIDLSFKFDASESYKQDRNVATFKWNFGDGSQETISTESIINHTYLNEGYYDVTLTINDNLGSLKTIQKNIYIFNSNVAQPPEDQINENLRGIDVDGNGVRDEVQRWIYFEAKDNSQLKTALLNYAKIQEQQIAISDNAEQIKTLQDVKEKATSCIRGIINNDDEANITLGMYSYMYSNSQERSRTMARIQGNLNGYVSKETSIDQTERLKSCEGVN